MYPFYLPFSEADFESNYVPMDERTCKRCKTRTMREVTMPDEVEPVAFCKLCGTTEPL